MALCGKCHTSADPIFFISSLYNNFTHILMQTPIFFYVYTYVYIFTHILI